MTVAIRIATYSLMMASLNFRGGKVMKYFQNVKSIEDLKNQFRTLAMKNHPDVGGNAEIMKEINFEYDVLFPIWKERHNTEQPENKTDETAESTRRHFYTEYGWEGSRYDRNLTLKEIAKLVRIYVKEKYPTCKFSVRTEYASMCQELHVAIKEFPEKMYKSGEDLKNEGLVEHIKTTGYDGEPLEYDSYKDDIREMERKLRMNQLFNLASWTDDELIAAYDKAILESDFYAIKTEYFKSVIDDVESFVESYNYDDSDSMIDYFDVNFYFLGVEFCDCKQVEKTARIKNKSTKPARQKKNTQKQEKASEITKKSGYTYKVTQGEDTRDGSILWVVRIEENLDKEEYISENKKMKGLGGYYSKFKHGFIFRFDPTERLSA